MKGLPFAQFEIFLLFYSLTDGAPVQTKILIVALTQMIKLESIVVDSFCYEAMNI